MELKTVIEEIDSPNICYEYEGSIYERFKMYKSNLDNQDEFNYELLAFELVESTGEYGLSFSPLFVPSGADVSIPALVKAYGINNSTILYWESRSEEANHPLLKARYLGLIIVFKKEVTGEKIEFRFRINFIEALILQVKNELIPPMYSVQKIIQALKSAISLNHSELIQKIKNIMIDLEDNVSEDKSPGLWGFCFDELFNSKVTLSDNEKVKIIDGLEQRLARFVKTHEKEIESDLWGIENCVKRLAKYYNDKSRIEDRDRVLDILLTTTYDQISPKAAIKSISMLEMVKAYYKGYNLNDTVNSIILKINELSKNVLNEMETFKTEIEFPKEILDEQYSNIIKLSSNEMYIHIALQFLPKVESVKEELIKLAREYPLQYIFGQQIMDSKGRSIASIDSIDTVSGFQGFLVSHYNTSIQYNYYILHYIFQKLINDNLFYASEIIALLKDKPFLENDRIELINTGVNYFIEGKYTESIHILIPQIEQILRNLLEWSGGNTLTQNKSGGYDLKTLGSILADERMVSISIDFVSYFKFLFNDRIGLNLRNDVVHGIASPERFNWLTSTAVIHSLLVLGSINLTKND